jgi:molybdenum ABC transporter molybdate-binding protein
MPQSRFRVSARRDLAPLVFAVAAALAVSCGTADDQGSAAAADDGGVAGTVTVLAAASLTDVFEALADELAGEYPDLEIVFSFGPSSGLVEQVSAGAPADVLATADTGTMDNAVADGAVEGEPVLFARNTLTLAVPAGNPGGISSLTDLAREDLRIALCEPQVPCGAAAERLLDVAGVTAAPDTLENDVRDTAGKVALGEVDAALIYLTDAAAMADDVDTIDIPEADEVVNDYPVAVLSDAANRAGADAFVQALTGEVGRRILGQAGFVLP